MKYFRLINIELLFWLGGLLYLSAIDPTTSSHLSICPLKNIGLDFCPGCGLGQSISYFIHGFVKESWQCHPLGIPALVVIFWRIVQLTRFSISKYKLIACGG
jgi:hypothetical protein